MQFIDTHAHLYLSHFDQDRNRVVENALKNQINKILLPNIDVSTITPMLDLCTIFPTHCFPMIGLHPSSVKKNYKDELAVVENYLKRQPFCAIGETGIDLYWRTEFLKEQIEAFTCQIGLSLKYDLPVVIHIRNAFDEVFEVLESFKNKTLKGVFHCFTGGPEYANKAIKMGFLLGIGGVVTFKNSGLDNTLQAVKLKHLVLETDSPYLAPHPFRGKRNESQYLQYIAQKVAAVYKVSTEKVADITTLNALSLFNRI